MQRDIAGIESNHDLSHLPVNVLLTIFHRCTAKDLGRLSQTCQYFQQLISDDMLWHFLCKRDFNLRNPDLGSIKSYYDLYKDLLHKHGWMFGTYLSCVGDYRGLSEIKYRAGNIECVNWEPEDPTDVQSKLMEKTVFQILGSSVPPVIQCFPNETSKSHSCSISFNRVRGIVKQQCLDPSSHHDSVNGQNLSLMYLQEFSIPQLTKMILYYSMMDIYHKPFLMPSQCDIPAELRGSDNSIPPHLISPGLFKGVFLLPNFTGSHILCFRYKNEYEILGIKVADDCSNKDGICLKVFLQEVMVPSLEQQESFEALLDCDYQRNPFIESLSQPFRIPEGCDTLATYPSTCKVRYGGFMRIGGGSDYVRVHVMIFGDDLIGILMLENQKTFHTYQRIHQKFTPNVLTDVESSV